MAQKHSIWGAADRQNASARRGGRTRAWCQALQDLGAWNVATLPKRLLKTELAAHLTGIHNAWGRLWDRRMPTWRGVAAIAITGLAALSTGCSGAGPGSTATPPSA